MERTWLGRGLGLGVKVRVRVGVGVRLRVTSGGSRERTRRSCRRMLPARSSRSRKLDALRSSLG
eukprot:scaffold46728_cov45-Phaeocystis_antarctica.AAC.1